MATPLPTGPDTLTVASATSGIAPFDLAAAIATVQAVAAASREHVAAVEATSQHEQVATAAAAATTSGDTTAPADLAAALTALQARVTTIEAEAQQARAAAAALELQLADVLGVATPPSRPATAPAPTLATAPGQTTPVAGTF
jgi:hypothetical protein